MRAKNLETNKRLAFAKALADFLFLSFKRKYYFGINSLTPFDKFPFDKLPFDKLPFDKLPFDKLPFDKLPFDKLRVT